MVRRLDIRKRFSLADLGAGWNSNCFFEYVAASASELDSLQPDGISEQEGVKLILKFVQDHITTGKGLILSEDGSSNLEDLTPSDVEILPPAVVNQLFMAITGAQYVSPKDSSAVATNEEPPAAPVPPSETPSSESSPSTIKP